MRSRHRAVLTLGVLAVLLAFVYLTRTFWLTEVGESLVASEKPERADAVVVLAGDWRGNRILKGCELVRSGFAPVVLVSGPMDFYGTNEADHAVRYAVSRGCPQADLQPVYIHAYSTFEEAQAFAPELARRNIHKLLLVTSDYHTARAGRIFRARLGDSVQVRTVAAPDPFFTPSGWWLNREGQKTVFYEVSKTVAGWIGL